MLGRLFSLNRALPGFRHQRFISNTLKNSCVPRFVIAPKYFSTNLTNDWPDSIKNILHKANIKDATTIQEKTLPLAMADKDVVGIARTGSGKTLAFAIPTVIKILKQRELDRQNEVAKRHERGKPKSPYCVIMAPTRELASQIADVFAMFRAVGINTAVLVGGTNRPRQISDLRARHHDVFIATPGRLNDLLDDGIVDLSDVKTLVLDEADRMLDMGMEPQIRTIVRRIPEDRQTLMFSATWPNEVQELASDFMKEFEYVPIDSETLKANPNINQEVQVCHSEEKLKKLIDTLKRIKLGEKSKVLLFVNMKKRADFIERQMYKYRIDAVTIHGNKTQLQRDTALRTFKRNGAPLMIATDVAARGLDISDITHVINFDFPMAIEDYIHRIGRTARHDRSGTSITFFTENDAKLGRQLIKVLKETKQDVHRDLMELSARG